MLSWCLCWPWWLFRYAEQQKAWLLPVRWRHKTNIWNAVHVQFLWFHLGTLETLLLSTRSRTHREICWDFFSIAVKQHLLASNDLNHLSDARLHERVRGDTIRFFGLFSHLLLLPPTSKKRRGNVFLMPPKKTFRERHIMTIWEKERIFLHFMTFWTKGRVFFTVPSPSLP